MRSRVLPVITALCVLALPARVMAQCHIESIDISRFPSVELRVSFSHSGPGHGNPEQGSIRLDENGFPQQVEFFDCPDDSVRLSVAILLDRSTSMARMDGRTDDDSTKIRAAKKAIGTFVDLLGARDQAALFSFTTDPLTLRHIFTVEHDFSGDAAAIKRALVPITAQGGTRLWQAIISAVAHLESRPGRRVLIVLTDGRNQLGESYHSSAILNALNAGIPVYAIGVGDDADIGALSGIAAVTGGRFYHAPETDTLEQVFAAIAATLMTDACVLRYTSSNPCLDGSRRSIDLEISGPDIRCETDSFYAVPDDLTPLTLSVQAGQRATGRDTIRVALTVSEQIPAKVPLSYSMTIGYGNEFMKYVRIETDGTISAGQTVEGTEDIPGSLHIRCRDFLPALPTGTLFELVFVVSPWQNDTAAVIRLLPDAEVRGSCPARIRVKDAVLLISACEDVFAVGDSLRIVIPGDGTDHRVPLRMETSLPDGAPVEVRVEIDDGACPFEVIGVDDEQSVAARGGALMQEIAPGIKEIRVRSFGGIGDSVLCFLRLRARTPHREAIVAQLPLRAVTIRSDCRTVVREDRGGNWATVLIDGVCEPILRRRTDARIGNHPNPFVPDTRVVFHMPRDGHALLHVMDAHGRLVATLLDADLRAGEYVHHFHGRGLPTGEYYAVLTTAQGWIVHRMLLVK